MDRDKSDRSTGGSESPLFHLWWWQRPYIQRKDLIAKSYLGYMPQVFLIHEHLQKESLWLLFRLPIRKKFSCGGVVLSSWYSLGLNNFPFMYCTMKSFFLLFNNTSKIVFVYIFYYYCFIESIYMHLIFNQEDLFAVIIWYGQSENHDKNVLFVEVADQLRTLRLWIRPQVPFISKIYWYFFYQV